MLELVKSNLKNNTVKVIKTKTSSIHITYMNHALTLSLINVDWVKIKSVFFLMMQLHQ